MKLLAFQGWSSSAIAEHALAAQTGTGATGPRFRGFAVGKTINGRNRHIVTDILDLMVGLVVQDADLQDRHGALDVLKSVGKSYPWLRHVFAERGYGGQKLNHKLSKSGRWTLEII